MKKYASTFLAFTLSAFLLVSCSKKMMFNTSTVVPAAQGFAKVKKDNNNNYNIEISLKHLAPSKNLVPPKEQYVVWMETENNGVQNIGQINSSSGLLSSTLKSSLKTVTSFRPTAVFITAEDNGNIQYPGSIVVLRTDPFSVK